MFRTKCSNKNKTALLLFAGLSVICAETYWLNLWSNCFTFSNYPKYFLLNRVEEKCIGALEHGFPAHIIRDLVRGKIGGAIVPPPLLLLLQKLKRIEKGTIY